MTVLDYAASNARLDACRKVLICATCGARRPWVDVVQATLAGWQEQDKLVNGQRVRFWYCQDCKAPPIPRAITPAEESAERWKREHAAREAAAPKPFGGRRTILVRLGETAGTQLAVVLEELPEGLRVTGWRVSSREWTKPKLVPPEKIFAPSARGDKRWRKALECWPPHWIRDEPSYVMPA